MHWARWITCNSGGNARGASALRLGRTYGKADVEIRVRTVEGDPRKEILSEAGVGDFTHWQKDPIPMRKTPDGIWQATVLLPPGEYHYRLSWTMNGVTTPSAGLPCGIRSAVRTLCCACTPQEPDMKHIIDTSEVLGPQREQRTAQDFA